MKRVFLIVIDSMGIGALADAPDYGDSLKCNTLCNVARANGGIHLPVMGKMGIGNLAYIEGVPAQENPIASYGIMKEKSKGKDTTTGHWEMAGIVLEKPFRTYPKGFPTEIIEKFIEKTNCGGVLGNLPASGTTIINELGDEHIRTGFPIVYTSADSVFQIAVHIDITPLEKLYEWCKIARELLNDEYNTSRVIARPFEGKSGNYTRISGGRRDFSLVPPKHTMLNLIKNSGGEVYGIGKIEDIFVKSGITKAVHTSSNKEGLEYTLQAIKSEQTKENELIFVNLVDTDMLYGHRNDYVGYKNALEEIDMYLEKFLPELKSNDILIITADHGCDPTAEGTDHTREQVPVLVYGKNIQPKNLGIRTSFCDIAKTILNYFEIENNIEGKEFQEENLFY